MASAFNQKKLYLTLTVFVASALRQGSAATNDQKRLGKFCPEGCELDLVESIHLFSRILTLARPTAQTEKESQITLAQLQIIT